MGEAWEAMKHQRVREGWKEGPTEAQPEVRVDPKVQLKKEGNERADDLALIKDFEGSVTDKPFGERKIRSKQWYSIWSLRASSLLHAMNRGKKITLDFPGANLQEMIPALKIMSRLPYLLHEKFKKNRWVSAYKYDRAAKELLAGQGDIWGKTGVTQAILAYWRAYQKMENTKEHAKDVNLILKIKKTYRKPTPRPAPKTTPKETPTFTNKDIEGYNPYKDLPSGTIIGGRPGKERKEWVKPKPPSP